MTVTPITVSSVDRVLGIAFVGQGIVHVHNGAINKYAGTSSSYHKIIIGTNSQPYVLPSVSVLKKDVLLHEILHLFGLKDNQKDKNGNYIYDIMSYTYNTATCPEPVIAQENQQKIQSCSVPK